jgi:hypothetical protein
VVCPVKEVAALPASRLFFYFCSKVADNNAIFEIFFLLLSRFVCIE